jgi:hypothetical protein
MAEFVLENINFDVEIPGEPISEKDLSDLEAKLGTRLLFALEWRHTTSE